MVSIGLDSETMQIELLLRFIVGPGAFVCASPNERSACYSRRLAQAPANSGLWRLAIDRRAAAVSWTVAPRSGPR